MSFVLKPGFSFGGWLPAILPEVQGDFPVPFSPNTDEYWLFQAFLVSMRNAALPAPNPAVGCVIVKGGKILAEGGTEIWGQRHAERVAFDQLKTEDLMGADVYVTMEPCTHTGKQPPCIEVFKQSSLSGAKLNKVVIGMEDPNPKVTQQGFTQIKKLGISCQQSNMTAECLAWNYPFYIQQTQKRPLIALKWAQSLDGCLADDSGNSKWISNAISRKYTHWLRQKYDVILVGAGTVLTDFPSLNVRGESFSSARNPLKVIYDPNGRTLTCNLEIQNKIKETTFAKGTKKVLIINGSSVQNIKADASANKQKWALDVLQDPEFLILVVNEEERKSPPHDIVACLIRKELESFLGRPLQSIFVEGGPSLLSLFIKEEFFDVSHVFIAPFFINGSKYKLTNLSSRGLTENSNTHIVTHARLGNDLLLEFISSVD